MCIYKGAIVKDKKLGNIIGEVSFVNTKTQVAIIDTGRGLSAVPTYMIEDVNGGERKDHAGA